MKKFYSIYVAVTSLLLWGGLALLLPATTHADPGHVIDDSIFEDTGSMSAAQIDTFLNGQSSSCISKNNSFSTPDPLGYSSTQGSFTFGSNVSGGQAIYDIAAHYHLNPQVLLAQLQKEQSIPTGSAGCHYDKPNPNDSSQVFQCDLWGSGTMYNCTNACPYGGGCMYIAMSYDCPGKCYANIEGFSKQLSGGAWVHRYAEERAYGNLTGYAGYDTGDENFCYHGPMTAGWRKRSASSSNCNGSPGNTLIYYDGTWTSSDNVSVNIANGATASLYNYTPFANDTKFQTIFNNWFGPTLTSAYAWQWQGQGVYTDSTATTSVDTNNLIAGQRYYVQVKGKNVGSATWKAGYVDLGTSNPGDRSSKFYDSSWLSNNRPATLQESSVAPDATGTFGFWITAPKVTSKTSFKEYFNPVAEGITWFNDQGMYFPLTVSPQRYSWSVVNQGSFYDSGHTIPAAWLAQTVPGQKLYARITAKNTGNMTWTNSGSNPVKLATVGDRKSSFCDSSWASCNRPAFLKESSVAPGQTGTFEFVLNPQQYGSFKESFSLVVEGKTWMNDNGLYYPIEVGTPTYKWKSTGQSAYSDAALTSKLPYQISMVNGQSYYLEIKAKNTGNKAWDSSIHVATSNPADRSSKFYDSSWLWSNRPAALQSTPVYPGQTGTFVFKITASQTGNYKEYFGLVAEGKAWFNDIGLYYPIVVN